MTSQEQDHPVGSLGEEAVRLLGALSGWVTQHGAEMHAQADDVARRVCEQVQEASQGFEEHLATGAAECTWCPVCRTVHAVRQVSSPEVRAHLTAAAVSLARAASALLAAAATPPSPADEPPGHAGGKDEGKGAERVQRIRLDDEPDA